MVESPGYLLHNLVRFGRLLRGMGLEVQPDGISNLIKATRWISIERREEFHLAARTLLIRRQQDLAAFDSAFEHFWSLGHSPASAAQSAPERTAGDLVSIGGDAGERTGSLPLAARVSYSPEELLRDKDFSKLDETELETIKSLLSKLGWQLGRRLTRRWRHTGRQKLDLRHILRQSLRAGGEPISLAYRDRRSKPRGIVVIADISGSMELYSELLLHFVHGLSASQEQWTEAFVFATRLTRITRQLRGRDVERALHQIMVTVSDWSGGTRIGQALKSFNFTWARRVLGRGPVVIMVSDGWDRGEPDLLRTEVARLQRSCYRLIWLNPLLGVEGYEPLTRGMQTALPYLDDFLPVHNLRSLEQLAGQLQQLEAHRPMRRQLPRPMQELGQYGSL